MRQQVPRRSVREPAYALLLVTGLSMVWVGDLDLTQFWLPDGARVVCGLLVLGRFVYTPALRNQIGVLASAGPTRPSSRPFQAGTTVGIVLAVDVIAIVFLMVTKPTL